MSFICFPGGAASLPPPPPLPLPFGANIIIPLMYSLHSYIYDSPYETGSYNLRVVRKVWSSFDIYSQFQLKSYFALTPLQRVDLFSAL